MGLIKDLGLFCLFLIFTAPGLNAQQENPFDIKNRVQKPANSSSQPKDSLKDSLSHINLPLLGTDSQPGQQNTQILRLDSLVEDTTDSILHDSIFLDTITDQSYNSKEEEEEEKEDSTTDLLKNFQDLGEVIPDIDRLTNQNLLFICTVIILIFLAILMVLKRSLISKAYKAIANDNYLRFLLRDYQSYPWLYWLFYIFFFINAGFFTFLLVHHFKWEVRLAFPLLIACIIFFSVVYFIKFVFLELMSGLFPVGKEAHLYSFVTILINVLLGLFLTPINLLIAFGPTPLVQIVVWIGIISFILLYLFRQLKGIFISGSFFPVYRFHFFLYLCAIEIAPLLIIGKVALTKLGIQ
jgi:hypothetical protein